MRVRRVFDGGLVQEREGVEYAVTTSEEFAKEAKRFVEAFTRIKDEIAKVIVGQEEIVEGVLIALFAGGNVLLEGVPGPGGDLSEAPVNCS